jgi:transcription initiation factor IIE alpha subunit
MVIATGKIVILKENANSNPEDQELVRADAGQTRLYQILVSEVTFLIWRLRNERVINQNRHHTEDEIRSRFRYILRSREAIEMLQTKKSIYKAKP